MATTLLTQAGLTLLIEAGLACILAVILGHLIWKSWDTALTLGFITFACNVILVLTLVVGFKPGRLLLDYLDPQVITFPDHIAPYLVHIYLILEIAVWTTALAGILGYFFDKEIGACLMAVALTIAAVFCVSVTFVSYDVFERADSTRALLAAIVLVGTLGVWLFTGLFVKGKGGILFAILWFEFCLMCWFGYQIAGRIGLLLITLPAQLIFWGSLYYFSILSLPISDYKKIPTLLNLIPFGETMEKPTWASLFAVAKDDMRALTFRSVLTTIIGTNYPHYVIEDWKTREMADKEKPDPRIAGNPFGQFFSGPGIVLTNCDHLAVVTDGTEFRVCPPGLNFTGQFELLHTDVDLRPQHRGATIQVETKDGISANIYTFMPNRIWSDGRKAELGASYPYDNDAIVQAVYHHSVIEHKFDRDATQLATEELTRLPWYELVTTMGPPILKDIMAQYTCNELHLETSDPDLPKYPSTQEFQQEERDIAEVASLNRADIPLDEKLRLYISRRLDVDTLKDIAFDASVRYAIFTHSTGEELSRALVGYFNSDEMRNYLAHQVQRRWPSHYLVWLFPNPSTYAPPIKVQVLALTQNGAPVNKTELSDLLSGQFKVAKDQITIIGAVEKAVKVRRDVAARIFSLPTPVAQDHVILKGTSLLIGVQLKAADLPVLSVIRPFGRGECKIMALAAYEDLHRTDQEAWRYASCSAPPTVANGFLQPSITWDDALEKSRIRNPRVEIANAFIGELKERMLPLGIEVVGGGISDIKVPEDITAQRITNWEAAREKDIEIAIAEAEARIALREQEMLTEVRSEILTRLTQILHETDDDIHKEVVAKQVLAVKLFEALGIYTPPDTEPQVDNAQEQDQNADCLPPHMLDLLKQACLGSTEKQQ